MSDFCCDQDILYDPHHHMFIWIRNGLPLLPGSNVPYHITPGSGIPSNSHNRLVLSVSTDAISWWDFVIQPTDLSSTLNEIFFDLPHIALTAGYLHISANLEHGHNHRGAVMMRFDLERLHSIINNAPPILHVGGEIASQDYTLSPVYGATDRMYYGTNLRNDHTLRLWAWPDTQDHPVGPFDKEISQWNATPRIHCDWPGGDHAMCGRDGNKIFNGSISHGSVGFFWDVDAGDGFPYPYDL